MKDKYSHIVIILDRSGSMESGRSDMQGGLNTFLADQKKFSQENPDCSCTLSFVKFDDKYELVHDFKNLQEVESLELHPRGGTALNDAIGKTITDVGQKLSDMNEEDRPSTVTVFIVTDGAENASIQFTTEQIKSMIQHQEEVYKWKFTYLGADQDSFAVANNLGLNVGSVANYSKGKALNLFSGLSNKMSAVRSASSNVAYVDYSEEERNDIA